MRRFLCLFLLFGVTLAARAASDSVVYVGGTLTTPVAGTAGTLDLSSPMALRLQWTAGTIEIPWTTIRSWSYSTEVAHHLGVLPAIAVGLVRKRQRVHLFRIEWQDEHHADQGIVLEVPKQLPNTLQTALEARTPKSAGHSGAMAGPMSNR